MASNPRVIVDTDPIVAFLREGESETAWVKQQFRALPAPFKTCEPALTEAFFLLAGEYNGVERLFDILDSGLLVLDFSVADEHRALAALMRKYRDLPMSLADACLVRMAELNPDAAVFTLDTHFRVYRKNARQVLPLIAP